MKKLLLLVLALAIAAGAGLLVADHYKNYQNKKGAQAVPTISVKEADQRVHDVQTAAGAEYQSLVVSYNHAVAECQKGVAAYARLTPYQKTLSALPACPAAIK